MEKKYFIYSFEKLDVYKSALLFSRSIRKVVQNFPKSEQYKLTSQIERSADSISSNIAEGSGRATNLDQAYFTNISYSSALETINHLNLALLLNYVSEEKHAQLRVDLDKIINQLNSLYKYQLNKKEGLKKKLKE